MKDEIKVKRIVLNSLAESTWDDNKVTLTQTTHIIRNDWGDYTLLHQQLAYSSANQTGQFWQRAQDVNLTPRLSLQRIPN